MDERLVVIRPPRFMRIYIGVFMTAWFVLLTIGLVGAALDGSPAAVIPAGMMAFGGFIGYRLWNLSVTATPDTLIIRNYLSTKRVSKALVEDFRLGTPGMGSFGKAIMALLHDGSVVTLDGTARPGSRWGGQRRLDTALADLRAWLQQ